MVRDDHVSPPCLVHQGTALGELIQRVLTTQDDHRRGQSDVGLQWRFREVQQELNLDCFLLWECQIFNLVAYRFVFILLALAQQALTDTLFVASFTAAVLVTPLGALSVVVCAIASHFILKVRPSRPQ